MEHIQIVYTSTTGNTAKMAETLNQHLHALGHHVSLCTAGSMDFHYMAEVTHWVLGCSASGVEELESDEFLPTYEKIQPYLHGKPVFLFGSYGWGGGKYMETWQQQILDAGGRVFPKSITFLNEPQPEELTQACKAIDLFMQVTN